MFSQCSHTEAVVLESQGYTSNRKMNLTLHKIHPLGTDFESAKVAELKES